MVNGDAGTGCSATAVPTTIAGLVDHPAVSSDHTTTTAAEGTDDPATGVSKEDDAAGSANPMHPENPSRSYVH